MIIFYYVDRGLYGMKVGNVWVCLTSGNKCPPPYWPIEASVRYADPLNWHVGPWNFPARPSPEG